MSESEKQNRNAGLSVVRALMVFKEHARDQTEIAFRYDSFGRTKGLEPALGLPMARPRSATPLLSREERERPVMLSPDFRERLENQSLVSRHLSPSSSVVHLSPSASIVRLPASTRSDSPSILDVVAPARPYHGTRPRQLYSRERLVGPREVHVPEVKESTKPVKKPIERLVYPEGPEREASFARFTGAKGAERLDQAVRQRWRRNQHAEQVLQLGRTRRHL